MEQTPDLQRDQFRPVNGQQRLRETGDTVNTTVITGPVASLLCPSDIDRLTNADGHINYAVQLRLDSRLCSSTNVRAPFDGLFSSVADSNARRPQRVSDRTGFSDITDGLSNTAAISERNKGIGVDTRDLVDMTHPSTTIVSITPEPPNMTTTPSDFQLACAAADVRKLGPGLAVGTGRSLGAQWYLGSPPSLATTTPCRPTPGRARGAPPPTTGTGPRPPRVATPASSTCASSTARSRRSRIPSASPSGGPSAAEMAAKSSPPTHSDPEGSLDRPSRLARALALPAREDPPWPRDGPGCGARADRPPRDERPGTRKPTQELFANEHVQRDTQSVRPSSESWRWGSLPSRRPRTRRPRRIGTGIRSRSRRGRIRRFAKGGRGGDVYHVTNLDDPGRARCATASHRRAGRGRSSSTSPARSSSRRR